MVALRGCEPGQVRERLPAEGRQLHQVAAAIAEPAQLVPLTNVVGDGDGFTSKLEDEHGDPEKDEEEEEACESEAVK